MRRSGADDHCRGNAFGSRLADAARGLRPFGSAPRRQRAGGRRRRRGPVGRIHWPSRRVWTCWQSAWQRGWRCRPPRQRRPDPRRRYWRRYCAAQPICWRWAPTRPSRGRRCPTPVDPQIDALLRLARRSSASGVALADAVSGLATQCRQDATHAAAATAERAGVLIAGPLGLCFLPAFVCLGIVPVIAGLAGDFLQSGLL